MNKYDIIHTNRKIPSFNGWNLPIMIIAFIYYAVCLFVDIKFRKNLIQQAKLYKESTDQNVSIFILSVKMLWLFTTEKFTPYEYRCYSFLNRNKHERQEYIPEESLKWTFKTDKRINKLPRNKYERYLLFSSLFHRDIMCLSNDNPDKALADYTVFQSQHDEAIFKPLKGAQGKGVKKITIKGLTYQSLRETIGTGDYMVEEVIKQGSELGNFHPSSINTIRYVTAMSSDGKYTVLYSMLRCGGGGSVVDNVGSGGYIMLISDNGVIETDAMRAGEYFDTHPDTGVKFKGYEIPHWDELQEIAESAHNSMPSQRLFGWDFAWTNNGWDLVEVNPGPAVVSFQILKGEGLKQMFITAGIL